MHIHDVDRDFERLVTAGHLGPSGDLSRAFDQNRADEVGRTKYVIVKATSLAREGALLAAEEAARRALGALDESGLQAYEAFVRTLLGYVLCALGRLPEGISELSQACDLTRAEPPTYSKYNAFFNFGAVLIDRGDVSRGVELCNAALDIARELQLNHAVAKTLNALAGAYMLSEDFASALEVSREAVILAEKSGEAQWILTAQIRSATALLELSRYDEAAAVAEIASAEAANLGLRLLAGNALVVWGKALRLLQRFDESRSSFEHAIRTFRELSHGRLLSNSLIHAAELELDTKQLDRSAAFVNEAIELAKYSEDLYGISSALDVLARIALARADYKAAYSYCQEYIVAQRQVITAEGQRRLDLLRFEREHEKLEQERELFRVKSEHLEEKLALQTTSMASQTELLSTFRDELRQIVRDINEPISALKKIKDKLKELPCEQIDWLKFEEQFQQVHPEFKQALVAKFPELTKQEARICQLLRVGMKSHEIGRLICISERGVENHRFNIRKKLGLKTEQSLTDFLASIR